MNFTRDLAYFASCLAIYLAFYLGISSLLPWHIFPSALAYLPFCLGISSLLSWHAHIVLCLGIFCHFNFTLAYHALCLGILVFYLGMHILPSVFCVSNHQPEGPGFKSLHWSRRVGIWMTRRLVQNTHDDKFMWRLHLSASHSNLLAIIMILHPVNKQHLLLQCNG